MASTIPGETDVQDANENPNAQALSECVGLIGAGLMGAPMARRLLLAGVDLTVFNRTVERARPLVDLGARLGETPARVAAGVDIVILMLADTPAVEQVLLGPDGVLDSLSPGSLVIDMGTTAVSATRAFAEDVRDAGADYIDAPVSGGVIGAEQGTLTIMAGGSEAAIARAMPLFRILGSKATRIGDCGAGQVAKAANQVIVGLTIAAVSEGLALASRAGADIGKVREALAGGFADSRILAVHGRRMEQDDFIPGGRVRTQRKDLDQALQLADQLGLELPVTSLCRDLYDRLIDDGGADLDHAALFRLYR